MRLGIYSELEDAAIKARLEHEDAALRLAETSSIRPDQAAQILSGAGSAPLSHPVRIVEVARRQEIPLDGLFRAVGLGADLDSEALVTADLEIKYAGYFERERAQAERMRRMGDFSSGPRSGIRRHALTVARGASEAFESQAPFGSLRLHEFRV